jgi:hypothetical protein
MATFRANHPVMRANMFAAGFPPAGDSRVGVPEGMTYKEARRRWRGIMGDTFVRADSYYSEYNAEIVAGKVIGFKAIDGTITYR